jgi:hypothetical protein
MAVQTGGRRTHFTRGGDLHMTCTETKWHLLPSPIDGFTARDEDRSGKRDSSQRGLHVMVERREREVGERRSRRRPSQPSVCAPEREE